MAEELGLQAIPQASAPDEAGRVTVTIPQAAADVLRAWDNDSQLKAVHEAGHLLCAVTEGLEVAMCDITPRLGGCTVLATDVDTRPAAERASYHFKRIVVAVAGRAAEVAVLGEPTTGNSMDFYSATNLAADRFQNAMDLESPASGLQTAALGETPRGLSDAMYESMLATLAKAEKRADEIVGQHREQLIALAQRIYTHRRLSGQQLIDTLVEVGLSGARVRPKED